MVFKNKHSYSHVNNIKIGSRKNSMFRGVGAMSISQELGKLLYITKHSWNVINVGNHFNGEMSQCKNVTTSLLEKFDTAIDVVQIGRVNIIFSKDGTNGDLYKMRLDNSGCPAGSGSVLYSAQRDIECGKGKGDSIVYSNGFIYTTGYNRHKICKYKDNHSTVSFIKSAGVSEGYKTDTSGNKDPYLYYPRGIEVGNGPADENLLYVANLKD